ncbi:AAA family ATPase [Chloroflexi bacterium TSY]|nr:AAA family ATPase [Chloroflexi bacterium TSY]
MYESDYDWETYPIIRLDFSRIAATTADELKEGIKWYLRRIARQYSITLPDGPYYTLLDELIFGLSTIGKVVILIDEYDKPLIDNLKDLEKAKVIRDTLRGFYTILKAMDEYIRFVFITGISKFSKVGVFSTMNNLDDMTMAPSFATAFGITEDELQEYFRPYILMFAEKENISPEILVQQIRDWYDGFCFVEECERVYNPFSTIQLFKKQRFSNYWFESGTPTFLINLLQEKGYNVESLEKLILKEIDFSTYELEHRDIVPLLFQTGYLTIRDYEKTLGEETIYHLSYPNREVENAFITYLLSVFSYIERTLSRSHLYKLLDALQKKEIEQVFLVLRVFFANIPYTLKVEKEAYYQTIFYVIFNTV